MKNTWEQDKPARFESSSPVSIRACLSSRIAADTPLTWLTERLSKRLSRIVGRPIFHPRQKLKIFAGCAGRSTLSTLRPSTSRCTRLHLSATPCHLEFPRHRQQEMHDLRP